MSSGDVGSISSVVKHEVSGFLAPRGDTEQLADYWLQLLTCRDRARQFGRVGRELAVNHWSRERMVRGYEDLLSKIYAAKAGAPHRVEQPAAEAQPAAKKVLEYKL